jgi:hypothetical protein
VAALCCAVGCAPAALSSIRSKIAVGDYATAHREAIAMLSNDKELSADNRRELKDDLCLSEYMIGQPTYTLIEQLAVCEAATKEPGSQSASILDKINSEFMRNDIAEVEAAFARRDLAGAERAALDYQSRSGSDPALTEKWLKQIWKLADEQTFASSRIQKRLLPAATAHARRKHPTVHGMNKNAFTRWVEKTASINGTEIFSTVAMKDSALKLSIDEANLGLAALHLDRLANINDAMVARCGCNANTDVAVAQTGFPAYIVRLDPETQISEVMVLPGGSTLALSAAPR